jgi:translation initiation factor 2B subunit (eIF-2B alpha/beta/delta family)
VTEWLDWPSYRRLGALVRSPDGGAAEVGALAATDLADFIEALVRSAPECYPDAVEQVAREIVLRQPAVAPLVALANAVLLAIDGGPGIAAAEARGFQKRLAASVEILSTVGAALIPERGAVLTHGASSSVRAALVAARGKGIRVVCAASPIIDEARRMAADLSAAGIPVEVVADSQVPDTLYAIDLVIVGAHALGPESAINGAGTAALAKEASNVGVRVLVLASADKALPAPLFDRAASAATASPALEVVRLAAFDSVVTELGVLDPEGARRLAESHPVSPRLA